MAQSIIIIAPRRWSLDGIQQRLSANWDVSLFEGRDNREIQIRDANCEWYVRIQDYDRDPKLLSEYLERPPFKDQVGTALDEALFFGVQFDDFIVCKDVLVDLLSDEDVLIDTTYGETIPGRDLKDRILSDPSYDWRKLPGN